MADQIPAPVPEVPEDEYDFGDRDPFSLAGRHALVTAAASEPGRTLAVGLAEAGADVSVTTLRDLADEEAGARETLAACRALGRRGVARRLDLADVASVGAAVATIEREVAPIDILVNAAHGARIKPVLRSTVEEWRAEFERNATSVFVATQAVGRGMVGRGFGRVVNLVSVVHDRGVPHAALFAASQAAVLGFTKSLGLEWIRSGVTVNALVVGFLEGLPGVQADPDMRAILERYIPLRRLGRPDDLAASLVYLCSDAAAFVAAETIAVDGAILVHA